MSKKLISILVAAMMVLALVPLGASAKSATRSADLPTKDDVLIDGSLLYEDWDGDSLNDPGWWLYNADGQSVSYNGTDYSNWVWTGFTSELHTGTDCMVSWSYKTGSGWTQDNWLITPDLNITTAGYMLGYYAMSYSSYYEDHLEVLVGELGVAYDYDSEGYSIDEDSWTTLISRYAVSGEDFYQVTASLDAYVGKTIAIAFRHQDTNQWAVMLDDVSVGFVGEPEPTPEPTPEPELGDLVQGYYFEEGSNAENFTFVDKDGDGFNWEWQETLPTSGQYRPYEGEGVIYSASYDNDTSTPLSPDNWAITPAVTLPNVSAAVTLYAAGQDSGGYHLEHFAIYCGLTADPDEMVPVSEEFITEYEYGMFYADLSDFAGETVYIAIRHYNVTDQFYLDVDQVEVWGVEGETPPEPTYYTVTFVDWDGTVLSTQEVLEGAAAEAPANPSRIGYTFVGWDVDFSNVTSDLTVTAQYELNLYQLVIYYQYEDGTEAAPTRYDLFFAYGEQYSIESPEIEGYTPDIAVVEGVMGNSTDHVYVTYHANEVPPTIFPGDVNCDGVVDSSDLTLAAAYAMNAGTVTEQGILNGDMNGDGVLNSADLSALYALIQG